MALPSLNLDRHHPSPGKSRDNSTNWTGVTTSAFTTPFSDLVYVTSTCMQQPKTSFSGFFCDTYNSDIQLTPLLFLYLGAHGMYMSPLAMFMSGLRLAGGMHGLVKPCKHLEPFYVNLYICPCNGDASQGFVNKYLYDNHLEPTRAQLTFQATSDGMESIRSGRRECLDLHIAVGVGTRCLLHRGSISYNIDKTIRQSPLV